MNFNPKIFLRNLTTRPGVYVMYGDSGTVLYVGKAKNLKKRLKSYFQKTTSIKTQSLMRQMQNIEVTITTENEALLLENNLIKQYKPRYNILLRDDKSYPYIYVSTEDTFPRIDFFRGKKYKSGKYFGPYPAVAAVRETLNLLQKIFRIRQCENSFFRSRTRPCLQYQIHRCTAPCVKFIDVENYRQDVKNAILFLEGKNKKIIEELTTKMEESSNALRFEEAAHYRNQIAMLRKIQQRQYITRGSSNTDVIGFAKQLQYACISLLRIRHGSVIGTQRYFPICPDQAEDNEVISAFISQHYLENEASSDLPNCILVNTYFPDAEWIARSLSTYKNRRVIIRSAVRGERSQWLKMAVTNAEEALNTYIANKHKDMEQIVALQALLQLKQKPLYIECFDVSHSSGEATVASCVVFENGQPNKKLYRRFNIAGIQKGDDYAALYQALFRHYDKLKREVKKIPDLLLIDGGKGQLHQAENVLHELGIENIAVLGIAKGSMRKPGLETLFFSSHSRGMQCKPDSIALHLIQRIRDEAHRFAITGHRQKRAKIRNISLLERISGIGVKRRCELLKYFGGLEEVKQASIEELAKVPGISHTLAAQIYRVLRE